MERSRVAAGSPPLGWQPSRFLADRGEAERAFRLAERLGSVNAAAAELGTTWPSLRKAFSRHGLGMPARNPEGHQQPGQGLFMADSEPGDGHVIGGAVAGRDPEGDVFVTAPLDLARGADPGAVGVQQHGQQHPRLVGGPAVPSTR